MAGKVSNIEVCIPLKLHCGLTGKYHAICHYSYNLPLAVIFITLQNKKSVFCHIFLKPVTNYIKTLIINNFKKMENTKKLIQLLTRIQIVSSIVWAILLITCYQVLGESYKEVSLILICGFFIEFLLISSSKNDLKKQNAQAERG